MMPYEIKETLITIKDIGLTFGDKVILKGVNAEVKDIVRPGCTQGQVVGILGPSGTGKTQLSRILAGLQEPTSGEVLISQDSTRRLRVRNGLVGMVAQHYPLFKHRTVLGNLIIAAQQTGLTAQQAKDKSYDYLKRFDLPEKAHDYPSQLSGGQRQRIAIIQQLLCSEHFLVFDEPTSGLDPIMKDRVCELINQVALLDERNTIFIISHDIPAVAKIADTIWLIGRDRDENGKPIAGSKIQKEYNLIERDLCWQPGIDSTVKFADFVNEVKHKFVDL